MTQQGILHSTHKATSEDMQLPHVYTYNKSQFLAIFGYFRLYFGLKIAQVIL